MHPNSATENPLARKKRVITEARKVQNREAQRAYRQRQKERRDALKLEKQIGAPTQQLQIRPRPVAARAHDDAAAGMKGPGSTATISDVALTGPDSNISEDIVTFDPEAIESIFTTLLPAELELELDTSDTSIDDLLNNTLPNTNNQPLLPATTFQAAEDDYAGYLPAPDSTMSTILASKAQSQSRSSTLYSNTLSTNKASFLIACAYNAACLGISIERFSSYDCMSLCSPFYRPAPPSTDPKSLLGAVIAENPFVPTHLRPTLPQILIPHHPVFDLIPLAGLRSRAIILSASVPHLVSMIELKIDIIDGGLVCSSDKEGYIGWSCKGRADAGAGAGGGHPWDWRSWKVAPWFWEKWKLLLDGEGGDLWG
ncbi:hypothetical protein BJX70DRAFT_402047 [Aspergillus crustosus]